MLSRNRLQSAYYCSDPAPAAGAAGAGAAGAPPPGPAPAAEAPAAGAPPPVEQQTIGLAEGSNRKLKEGSSTHGTRRIASCVQMMLQCNQCFPIGVLFTTVFFVF